MTLSRFAGAQSEAQDISLLAHRAEEGRSPALDDTLDGPGASRRDAALAGAVVDPEMMLEIAELAVRAAVIAQRRAAGLDGVAQHRLDGIDQALGPFIGRASAGRNGRGEALGRKAGPMQRFADIDVAEARHHLLIRQRCL